MLKPRSVRDRGREAGTSAAAGWPPAASAFLLEPAESTAVGVSVARAHEPYRQLENVPSTSLLDVEARLPLMVVLSRVADPPAMKAAPPPIPSLRNCWRFPPRRRRPGHRVHSRAGAPGSRGGGTTVARARGGGAVGLVARDEVGGLGLFRFLPGPELRIDGEGSGRQIGEAAADANAPFAGVAALTAGGVAAGAPRGAGIKRQSCRHRCRRCRCRRHRRRRRPRRSPLKPSNSN